MNNDDYGKLAELIRSQFIEFGLSGLADMYEYRIFLSDMHEYRRPQEDSDRFPDNKILVTLILEALDRHLAVLSEDVVTNSIIRINENLDKDIYPKQEIKQALLHYPSGISPDFEEKLGPEPIRGIQGISQLREQLRKLQQGLDMGREPPGPDRGPTRGPGRGGGGLSR